jgi:hypothetical protein
MNAQRKAVSELSLRLIGDLAQLMSGHSPPLDYVHATDRAALIKAVEPMLETGRAIRPNIGQYGDVNAKRGTEEWNVGVTFFDLSTVEDRRGTVVARHDRRIRLGFTTDLACQQVWSLRIAPGLLEPGDSTATKAPPDSGLDRIRPLTADGRSWLLDLTAVAVSALPALRECYARLIAARGTPDAETSKEAFGAGVELLKISQIIRGKGSRWRPTDDPDSPALVLPLIETLGVALLASCRWSPTGERAASLGLPEYPLRPDEWQAITSEPGLQEWLRRQVDAGRLSAGYTLPASTDMPADDLEPTLDGARLDHVRRVMAYLGSSMVDLNSPFAAAVDTAYRTAFLDESDDQSREAWEEAQHGLAAVNWAIMQRALHHALLMRLVGGRAHEIGEGDDDPRVLLPLAGAQMYVYLLLNQRNIPGWTGKPNPSHEDWRKDFNSFRTAMWNAEPDSKAALEQMADDPALRRWLQRQRRNGLIGEGHPDA